MNKISGSDAAVLLITILISFVVIGGSAYLDYYITNDFLARMGFDKLSFFQVTCLGYFTRLMVGAKTFEEPMIEHLKKQARDKMEMSESVDMMMKYAIMHLIHNGLAYAVYTYIVIPKFLS